MLLAACEGGLLLAALKGRRRDERLKSLGAVRNLGGFSRSALRLPFKAATMIVFSRQR